MSLWIYLMLAGAAGTAARYGSSKICEQFWGARFPYGTMFVNLLGCLLIGFFVTIFQNKGGVSKEIQTVCIVGFLGAFTTFSSFIFESTEFSRQGQQMLALGYILLSVAAGFLLFQLGVILARMI